jgi:hypothetical protein
VGGPRFDLRVDQVSFAEDLSRATNAARAAIETAIKELSGNGVPVASLRSCDAEARNGTCLGGCVKYYIPQPDGRWGAVFVIDVAASKPALLLLAVGERHPAQRWKPTVYEVAHRRLNRDR